MGNQTDITETVVTYIDRERKKGETKLKRNTRCAS